MGEKNSFANPDGPNRATDLMKSFPAPEEILGSPSKRGVNNELLAGELLAQADKKRDLPQERTKEPADAEKRDAEILKTVENPKKLKLMDRAQVDEAFNAVCRHCSADPKNKEWMEAGDKLMGQVFDKTGASGLEALRNRFNQAQDKLRVDVNTTPAGTGGGEDPVKEKLKDELGATHWFLKEKNPEKGKYETKARMDYNRDIDPDMRTLVQPLNRFVAAGSFGKGEARSDFAKAMTDVIQNSDGKEAAILAYANHLQKLPADEALREVPNPDKPHSRHFVIGKGKDKEEITFNDLTGKIEK